MLTARDCRRDVLDWQQFFAEHWRKRPLFVPGGAEQLLERRWSETDFVAARAQAVAADSLRERDGEVTFIEQVSAYDENLARRADDLRTHFGAPTAWFDAIRTYMPSGIGAHFDHSDNFVLQQDGVKEWRLASPTNIDRSVIARRMMNDPDVGGHELPDVGVLEFTVEPGDLLYIPLFWLHSGVSHAASLSLSLVCPAVSMQTVVLSLIAQVARAKALGSQPVAAFHVGMSEEERRAAAEDLQRGIGALLDRLSRPDLVDVVGRLGRHRLSGMSAEEGMGSPR